jgi:tetratricopeptide (TPR) repeat protein
MKKLFQLLKFLAVCLIVVSAQNSVPGQNGSPDLYDIYSTTIVESKPTKIEMQKVVNSDLGERFLKAYLANDSKLATNLWASMLKRLEKVDSIEYISQLLVSRFALDVPDDQPMKPQYLVIPLDRFLLAATEKALTKNHRFYADCLNALAAALEKGKHWEEAANLRTQEYKLDQKLFGAEIERTVIALTTAGIDRTKLKEYAQAESLLKGALAIAEKRHYEYSTLRASKAYYNLFLATGRKEEATKLLNDYSKKHPR